MKHEFSRQIFEKSPNFKFHKNPSSGSRVVPYGQTYMEKPLVAFRNFANAPISDIQYWHCHTMTKLHTAQPACERGSPKSVSVPPADTKQ